MLLVSTERRRESIVRIRLVISLHTSNNPSNVTWSLDAGVALLDDDAETVAPFASVGTDWGTAAPVSPKGLISV